MYYHEKSLTTVVSFHKLQCVEGLRIHYDSNIEDVFHVEYNDEFYDLTCGGGGLYYYVMPPLMDKTKSDVTQYSLYSTVTSNKEYFTNQEVKRADTARELQRTLGWPSDPSFKHYISHNLVRNSPITVDNISRATVIYGPALPILQGKMTRTTPPIPQLHPCVELPLSIKQHHKWIDLAIDFFGSTELPFYILNPIN